MSDRSGVMPGLGATAAPRESFDFSPAKGR